MSSMAKQLKDGFGIDGMQFDSSIVESFGGKMIGSGGSEYGIFRWYLMPDGSVIMIEAFFSHGFRFATYHLLPQDVGI